MQGNYGEIVPGPTIIKRGRMEYTLEDSTPSPQRWPISPLHEGSLFPTPYDMSKPSDYTPTHSLTNGDAIYLYRLMLF